MDAARRVVVAATASSSAPSAPRPDGFGFSAAGMIFPYHVGAWEVLIETGLLTSDTPVAGASAGALVAAMHACGVSPDDGKRILMSVLADCRENGVVGRVGSVLEAALLASPPDAHERCSRGVLHVSVTSPVVVAGDRVGFNRGPVGLDGELISSFESFDDLIGALLSSCHIPLYCGWPARRYRGRWRVDGGWTRLAPTPPGCASPARVASFPLLETWNDAPPGDNRHRELLRAEREFLGGLGLFGCARVAHRAGRRGRRAERRLRRVGAMGAQPQADDVLERLVAMGREDAERWAKKCGHARGSRRHRRGVNGVSGLSKHRDGEGSFATRRGGAQPDVNAWYNRRGGARAVVSTPSHSQRAPHRLAEEIEDARVRRPSAEETPGQAVRPRIDGPRADPPHPNAAALTGETKAAWSHRETRNAGVCSR